MLPEYLDYYNTACIWMSLVSLKKKNGESLTAEEQLLLEDVQVSSFNLPEPILRQVQTIGNIVSSTGQHLYVSSPSLPTAGLCGFGGYYGDLQPPADGVDNNIHNLYEEIPCLGVLAEGIRNLIGNGAPGPYDSNITYEGRQPGPNLLGFRPLNSRRNEAKNLAFDNGITKVAFRDFPANTGYNSDLMSAISNLLATTSTFKITPVVFPSLADSGLPAQLIITQPKEGNHALCVRSKQIPATFLNASPEMAGVSLFFNPQLVKNPGNHNDHSTWCVIPPQPTHPIPEEWVQNRNIRQNTLPTQYRQSVFISASQNVPTYRRNVLLCFVLTKR